jgi:endonuclease YncB( thermonuclease family)
MVQNGHAWFADHYSADHTLLLAQQQAQQTRLGLWKSHTPTPPWKWRKNHPHAMLK